MNMAALMERMQDWVKSVSKNPNNPDWYYSLSLKTWHQALQSAIGFLAGHFPGNLTFVVVLLLMSIISRYLFNMYI